MDGAEFRETVATAKETELGRLGSEKFLIAITDADLSSSAILEATANSEYAAMQTYGEWAEESEDDRAGDVFADVAAQERDHFERVTEHLPDEFEPVDGGPMHTYLRGREDAIERVAAGLVGRGLVSDQTHVQIVGFYVNEPDEAMASLFRDLRTETARSTQTGLELLEDLCTDEDDWERARMVAEYVIEVAYDDFADTVRGMGLDPKPIC